MQAKLTVKEYTAALKDNRLLGLKCLDCASVTAPPRMVCRMCASTNLDVMELSGKGQIITFTTVYVPPENRRGQTPYNIVMVETDEGPWIMGNLDESVPPNPPMSLIGQRVKTKKRPPSGEDKPEDGAVPLFSLAD